MSIALFSVLLLCSPMAAQTFAPAPENDQLVAFLGRWKSEGKQEESPFGPATTWSQTFDVRWLPGRIGMIRHDQGQLNPGGGFRSTGLFWFDPKAKTHRAYFITHRGEEMPFRVTFPGDAMVWFTEVPVKERVYKVRGTLKPLASGTRSYMEEYSEDGQTWKAYLHATDTRMK